MALHTFVHYYWCDASELLKLSDDCRVASISSTRLSISIPGIHRDHIDNDRNIVIGVLLLDFLVLLHLPRLHHLHTSC